MGLIPEVTKEGSLADKAYLIVKDAIIRNHLTPSMVLTEEQLAKDLGISRTPVRQVLERLAYEKLIRFQRGRGAVVAEISEDSIRHVYEVRRLVEPAAARMAAKSARPQELLQLRSLLESQEASAASQDYVAYLQQDYQFHVGVARGSRNDILYEIVCNLSVHVQRFLILSRNLPWKATVAAEEHRAILSALESHDEDAAERAMLDHVTKVRIRLADTGSPPGQEAAADPSSPDRLGG